MRSGVKSRRAKPPAEEAITFEVGSGNVYADLGLPNPEELLTKAGLVQRIIDVLKERRLTEVKAAALLGLPPTEMRALLRGQFDTYPSDQLFRFLNVLGQDVEIVVRPARNANGAAATRVTPG